MQIGVPKEIKTQEYRVGLAPWAVASLARVGHTLWVEQGAGRGAGFTDADYTAAGARIAADADEVYARAELIVKVKEPQLVEFARLRPGQLLFSYLHLAVLPGLTRALMERGVSAIALETVSDAHGALPLLAPMSEIAGRLAVQAGAHCLETAQGGSGVLLAGASGVAPGRVTVLGGGSVGANAARIALGLGARVTLLDISPARLRELAERFGAALTTLYAAESAIADAVAEADLVIGAVLLPGATAPKLVTRAMVARMRPGSVIVDVAIDQGGCCETSRPTTHDAPTYVEEGVLHYCVTNMPSAVARTATLALCQATLPYVQRLAARGLDELREDAGLRAGLNVHAGLLTQRAVAGALHLSCTAPEVALREGRLNPAAGGR
jgi:alanine dehydrogenase